MQNNTVIESKLLSTKKVFQAKHFRVDQIVVSKEGKEFTKDVVVRVPIVLILPYTRDGDVYLELQWRDALSKTSLEVVAGSVEESEDMLVAAKRELQEETGLTAQTWKKIATWDLSVNMSAKVHVFIATDLTQGESSLDDDESIEVVKMPLEEALEKITRGEITAANHIAALLLFDKMKREGKI